MADDRDPFELLRRLAPAPEPGDELGAEARRALVVATGGAARPRRRTRRIVVIAVAAVSAGATAVAAAVWPSSEPMNERTISCWRAATPGSEQYVVSATPEDNPVARCAEPWTNGVFGSDAVPPLVACVDDAGTAVVLPGDACHTAGLRAYEQPSGDSADSVELGTSLTEAFLDRCLDEDESLEAVAAVLEELGLDDDWGIAITIPFDDVRRCGSTNVVDRDRRVEIVPVPR